MVRLCFCALLWGLSSLALADERVVVGVPGVLTGDLAVMGDNIKKTIQTYQRHYLRHPVQFVFEDAKKSGAEGLSAYKKLIEVDRADMLIGGSVSNGTMAAAALINQSKTVMITPLTGGSNVDNAGEYIFRIGNSDILNATQQADLFLERGIKNVALFTEQTEYTQDIAQHFREYFTKRGGNIVFDEDFLPDLPSFRSTILRLKSRKPQAVFMSTQTGLAFGIFIKEYRQIAPGTEAEIHTNFVAACNPDAFKAAGAALDGVRYLSPYYDRSDARLQKFFEEFERDHGSQPAIPMHSAGTFDSLELLQSYLDKAGSYSSEGFHDYLLREVKTYKGLMGLYSFDSRGNADIGFSPYVLKVADQKVLASPVVGR